MMPSNETKGANQYVEKECGCREEKRKTGAEAREAAKKARIEASLEASRNAGKRR